MAATTSGSNLNDQHTRRHQPNLTTSSGSSDQLDGNDRQPFVIHRRQSDYLLSVGIVGNQPTSCAAAAVTDQALTLSPFDRLINLPLLTNQIHRPHRQRHALPCATARIRRGPALRILAPGNLNSIAPIDRWQRRQSTDNLNSSSAPRPAAVLRWQMRASSSSESAITAAAAAAAAIAQRAAAAAAICAAIAASDCDNQQIKQRSRVNQLQQQPAPNLRYRSDI